MKTKYKILLFLIAIPTFAWVGSALHKNATSDSAPAKGRKVLYYQDSMHPWVKSDRPGKCTICAMDLTPILEGEKGFGLGDELVVLSSNSITVVNVQAEEVKRMPLCYTLRVAGTLEPDNTRKAIIAAPAPGRIDDVAVPSAGVDVRKGQPLASFYSPDLTFQTRRYIFRDRLPDRTNEFGPNPFSAPGSSRHAQAHPSPLSPRTDLDPFYNDLLAPLAGTIVERNVFDGQYVAEGDRLFTIVDCSVLWFRFDVYEQQVGWLEPGQRLDVSVPAIPGRVFPAVIAVIEPTVNDSTRTIRVRADVQNPVMGPPGRQHRPLKLGMYAEGRLQAEGPEVLTLPRSAVLLPGDGAFAYVEQATGAYERREVRLGRQGDDYWEVLQGLDAGDRVVTSGHVLIDAQAQFSRGPARGTLDDPAPASVAQADHPNPMASHDTEPEPTSGLSQDQQSALTKFLAAANGVSRALAADRLDELKPHTAALPALAGSLATEMGTGHPWQPLLKRIQSTASWGVPSSLEAARKAFLPFSTNVVELVQMLRASEDAFRSLKVYKCPMAPKPGLWFQAEGPLRNPYFGAEMLICGTEVKVQPARPQGPSKAQVTPSSPATHSPAPAAHAHSPAASASPPPSAPAAKVAPPPPAEHRPAASSQIESPNSHDHSALEDRTRGGIAAWFAAQGAQGTNGARPSGSPLSARPAATRVQQSPPAQP
ncbi:MAG TPA: efflux RND transporter periplasmic adaptor subunit [Verrucomicrobiota bacterium]|nr:efflux RND transporter periplasmic adaptor subunit [Verrucomicrobiota bacterium]HQL79061.1 efflux RND transporter periplasmic adaptor subunit [Verrucomicrobiota bacterium]